ncbi:ribonuclease P protein component [Massilia violaceinigra]|uniref:Ribonuclease P protein component n=1 Tax=Massilia violaceinigra TaxID=2045208 RepID=A0A2D2DDS2_9BURK|nr:ribonuclease P protein component [Massilia violaceinigra]ATQ73103.1 ribonuclease P protein component [Massilia violaceinigra]
MTSEGSHDFARVRRIVKTDEFSSVFRLRPAQKTAHFVLYTRSNDLPHARLGVVVAKRFAPRAVTRNTIKRVTRELFRMAPLPPVDCIVRLARPVNTKQGPATTAALKAILRAEIARLFSSQAPRSAPHSASHSAPHSASPGASHSAPRDATGDAASEPKASP